MLIKKLKNNASIGLSEDIKNFSVNQLYIIVSDEYVIFTKLFKFHWNVEGVNFGPLHALFEKGYEMLFKNIDATAERCTMLGYCAPGTLKEFSSFSRIEENPGENPSPEKMIVILCNDFESLIMQIRETIHHLESSYKDVGTSNFLTDKIEEYEKYLWILRSHNL